jgi:hypothetical protein
MMEIYFHFSTSALPGASLIKGRQYFAVIFTDYIGKTRAKIKLMRQVLRKDHSWNIVYNPLSNFEDET